MNVSHVAIVAVLLLLTACARLGYEELPYERLKVAKQEEFPTCIIEDVDPRELDKRLSQQFPVKESEEVNVIQTQEEYEAIFGSIDFGDGCVLESYPQYVDFSSSSVVSASHYFFCSTISRSILINHEKKHIIYKIKGGINDVGCERAGYGTDTIIVTKIPEDYRVERQLSSHWLNKVIG